MDAMIWHNEVIQVQFTQDHKNFNLHEIGMNIYISKFWTNGMPPSTGFLARPGKLVMLLNTHLLLYYCSCSVLLMAQRFNIHLFIIWSTNSYILICEISENVTKSICHITVTWVTL